MSGGHTKFVFDTVFDNAGDVTFAAPRPKRSYSADEVEAISQAARADGERAALTTRKSVV